MKITIESVTPSQDRRAHLRVIVLAQPVEAGDTYDFACDVHVRDGVPGVVVWTQSASLRLRAFRKILADRTARLHLSGWIAEAAREGVRAHARKEAS